MHGGAKPPEVIENALRALFCEKNVEGVGRDNVFPLGSVLKPEVGTLLRSLVG